MVIPNLIESKTGHYLISLIDDYEINHDFYCAIIFLDLDSYVDSDVLELIPGTVFVCRDETVYRSALRKGIVLGVIFNDEQK